MAYIGNIPADKYTSFAKQDFTVTATTSYTLDHSVSNEFEIALFINFIRQEPTTSYTCSGNQLTLTEATSVGDDMYCVFIGKAVQTVTPANNTITSDMIVDGTLDTATLADDAVTTAKIADSSVTSAKLSGVTQGITMADSWRLNADKNGSAVITSSWERQDTNSYGGIGTGLTESSGVFSFPQTGIYFIMVQIEFYPDTTEAAAFVHTETTIDNSTYATAAINRAGDLGAGNGVTTASSTLIDVTDISNVKFRFRTDNFSTNTKVIGGTSYQRSGFTIYRLGDT